MAKTAPKKAVAKKAARSPIRTTTTKASVEDFITAVNGETKRADARSLLKLYEKVTGWKPQMWGPAIVGYGRYAYTYDSGHSGEMCVVGFSPRKAAISIYGGINPKEIPDLMSKLGKHKTGGGGCIYVNKLADIDKAVLEKILKAGVANMKKTWPVMPA
jgi:hypothetical protein